MVTNSTGNITLHTMFTVMRFTRTKTIVKPNTSQLILRAHQFLDPV